LLKIFPEWGARIKEMGRLGNIWTRVSSAWRELEVLYEQGDYKKLYERLSELQPAELEEHCEVVSLGSGARILCRKGGGDG
jgi:hypothetical protein